MKSKMFVLIPAIALSVASLALPTLSSAQLPVAALTAAGGASEFGFNVAISDNTVVVTGASTPAYVYTEPVTGWTDMTQTATLSASDGSSLYAVAISGNTIVAGSYLSGEAFVFVEPPGGWTNMTETAKLTSSNNAFFFGQSVAINLLANTIVVGAPETNTIGPRRNAFHRNGPPTANAGALYVFEEPAGGWTSTTENAMLTASDGVAGDGLGWSVAVNGDTIVGGAVNATVNGNQGQGALYVFENLSENWSSTTQTAKLTANNQEFSGLGLSVSASDDTILGSADGSAFVWVKPGTFWFDAIQNAQLSDSEGRGGICEGQGPGCFGNSVSLWDGFAIVGIPGYAKNPVSGADIFIEPESGWTNMTQTRSTRSPIDYGHSSYGYSVAASQGTFVVGYPETTLIVCCNYAFVYQ
jgi:hypothetical protein